MRKALDFIISVLATICMFAFPVALIGGVPFLGDTLLHTFHFSLGNSVMSALKAVMLMLGSSAAIMLIAFPLFAGVSWMVFKLARYSANATPASRATPATAAQPSRSQGGTFLRPTRPATVGHDRSAVASAARTSASASGDQLRAAKRDALIRQTGRDQTP